MVNTEGGECGERRLEHVEQAEQFYRSLRGQAVRVGMEASGHARWFERLLAELGMELWIGNPAAIRAAEPRKQKTDARDAEHLLRLLMEGRFERLRIWVPRAEERDLRQLVLHRHRLVEMRTRVKNQLRAVALNEGVGRSTGAVEPEGAGAVSGSGPAGVDRSAARGQLGVAGGVDAAHRSAGPGGGAGSGAAAGGGAVADVSGSVCDHGAGVRADDGRSDALPVWQAGASYLGLIPSEDSSGGRQRLGHISKQGNALLRRLLVEAAHSAVRGDAELGCCYCRLAMKKNRSVAAVAVARKLAERLWWMWLRGLDYGQWHESGSHAG